MIFIPLLHLIHHRYQQCHHPYFFCFSFHLMNLNHILGPCPSIFISFYFFFFFLARPQRIQTHNYHYHSQILHFHHLINLINLICLRSHPLISKRQDLIQEVIILFLTFHSSRLFNFLCNILLKKRTKSSVRFY